MPTFAIELESAGLLCELRLNDVRIDRDLTAVPRMREVRVNHWIVPGENVLELWLGTPRGPADETAVEVEWFRWEDGESRTAARREAGYRWARELRLPEGELRRAWDAALPLGNAFGRWAWQDAEPADLDEADRAAIVGALEGLRAALEAGDVPAVRSRLALQNEEMARAHGLDPAARDASQRQYLAACLGAPRRRIEPLDAGSLVFTPHAHGRLVSVTDRFGLPPVRGSAGSATFDLPSTFSKIGGAWTVVR